MTERAKAILRNAAARRARERFAFTLPADDHGVTYTPWTDGHAVGFRLDWPDGARSFIYLNPSSVDDGAPDLFLYYGPNGDPGNDDPWHFYIPTHPESSHR